MTAISRNKKPTTPDEALIRLEDLCARSEQCVEEIRRRLYMWQICGNDAEKIVKSLVQRRFVDDTRYAAAFVRDKYRFARWGRLKIEMALRQKRIDSTIIADAIAGIDDDEYRDALMHIIAAKAKTMDKPYTYENRMRLMRFALSRGFESSLVAIAIKNIINH